MVHKEEDKLTKLLDTEMRDDISTSDYYYKMEILESKDHLFALVGNDIHS